MRPTSRVASFIHNYDRAPSYDSIWCAIDLEEGNRPGRLDVMLIIGGDALSLGRVDDTFERRGRRRVSNTKRTGLRGPCVMFGIPRGAANGMGHWAVSPGVGRLGYAF